MLQGVTPSRFFAAISFKRICLYAIIAVAIGYIWYVMAKSGFAYEWQWNRIWRYFGSFTAAGFTAGPLLKGIGITLAITVLGLVFSTLIGFLAALLRLGPWPFCNFIARAYITVCRNTPLLLQLFFAYFIISPLLDVGPFWTAVFALSAFEGACFAEIFRAGILSVHKAQWESALSLGFSLSQTIFLVILPQATANSWPAITNQAVALLKDTSLVSAIAVADLTMRSQAIVAETFMAFEVWLLAGAIYLFMALCIAVPGLCVEHYGFSWRKNND